MRTIAVLLSMMVLGNILIYAYNGTFTLFGFIFVVIGVLKAYLIGLLFDKAANIQPIRPQLNNYYDHRDYSTTYNYNQSSGREVFEIKGETSDGRSLTYKYGKEIF